MNKKMEWTPWLRSTGMSGIAYSGLCAEPIVPPRQSVIDTAIRFAGLFLLSFATTGTERLAEPRRLKAEPFRPLVHHPNFFTITRVGWLRLL
jgi:hypothetical protein